MLLHLTVNERIRAIEIDANTSVQWVLREQLGMTGPNYGSGIAACGTFPSVRPAFHAGADVRGSR
jgi:aerobic-type carbon monoxide dehydrogenase small subunit (CoxS/CutS family)